jgi:hypothetical protein
MAGIQRTAASAQGSCSVGALAERPCSGVAAAASEDPRLLEVFVCGPVDIDDPGRALDEVGGTVVGGVIFGFEQPPTPIWIRCG